jgi:hypothetical protein
MGRGSAIQCQAAKPPRRQGIRVMIPGVAVGWVPGVLASWRLGAELDFVSTRDVTSCSR